MLQMLKTSLALMLIFILCFACAPAVLAQGEVGSIVCTSFPCYDFVRAVLGDAANIHLLIKPGMEVHSFEPTPADVLAIAGCDLFVYIGGESDAWVLDILDSFGDDAPETLRMFDCVEVLEAEGHDHVHEGAHEYDEHIWTSPANASEMINATAEAFCRIYPDTEDLYRKNAEAYIAQIGQIDAEFAQIVENGIRKEMIFADRFPFLYFAREYGIEYASAFPSCSAESEPSAKTIAELIGRIHSEDIPVVYALELSNGKTAQTIAEETGAKVLQFHSIQNVTEADFAAGETYVSLMRRNIEALREGLN